MSVSVSWTITCEGWLGDHDDCDWSCDASNDGDGFYPTSQGWHTVDYGNNEDEGEYYCPPCAARHDKLEGST